jgi:DNA-binding NarL/FixJ family response regulator
LVNDHGKMKLSDTSQHNPVVVLSGHNSPSAAMRCGAIFMNLRRVILVDDNPDFLAVSREFLEAHEGVEVVATATSAHEALTMIDAAHPTVLITDMVMPGINGLDLTQQVKERWPMIHVIVLTMHNTARHRDAALSAGADAFITKSNMDSELMPALAALPDHSI